MKTKSDTILEKLAAQVTNFKQLPSDPDLREKYFELEREARNATIRNLAIGSLGGAGLGALLSRKYPGAVQVFGAYGGGVIGAGAGLLGSLPKHISVEDALNAIMVEDARRK